MRIISKFKDYYDGAATMLGQEPIYIRNEVIRRSSPREDSSNTTSSFFDS